MPERRPRLLIAAGVSLGISAVLAALGFVFDAAGTGELRMDDMVGWVCLFAGIAIVLAISHAVRSRGASAGRQRAVTAAIIGVAAIPLLVVALFVAFLIALCGGGNCN